MPTAKQIESFLRRAIAALPDSIEMQKSDLEVLVHFLPRNCSGRKTVVEMLSALKKHDRAQQEFIFKSASSAKSADKNSRQEASK